MSQLINRLLCLFAGFVFCGCEKVIEPKNLPEQEERLVVNCILSSDSAVVVEVSLSRSILSGKDYMMVNNAVCELYGNGVLLEKISGGNNGVYVGKSRPKPNTRYLLRVAAPGYDAVEGGTEMNGVVAVRKVERYDTTETFYAISGFEGSYLSLYGTERLRITIADEVRKPNFYTIVPQIEVFDSLDNFIARGDHAGITYLNALDDSERYWSNSIETDDAPLINGDELYLNLEVYFNANIMHLPAVKKVKIYLLVSNISEELSRYSRTVREQAFSSGNFFSEPVHPYSNMSNGMGIVGANVSSRIYLGERTLLR